MTKFIFLTDTHIGAKKDTGFTQQKRYVENAAEIFRALDLWIKNDSAIDFVLHGGDIVDYVDELTIKTANEIFKLSVPVYFCLGNHDLTSNNSPDLWIKYASDFFINNSPNFSIISRNLAIHIIPNQWGETPYHWNGSMSPHFLPEQAKLIFDKEKELTSIYTDEIIHMLCTHNEVMGISAEQTGLDSDIHVPPKSFQNEVKDILKLNPKIKFVLSGHNHVNTIGNSDEVFYITTSSLVEVPFEFKLIKVENNAVNISTISLADSITFKFKYDYSRTFVQGREKDRKLEWIR